MWNAAEIWVITHPWIVIVVCPLVWIPIISLLIGGYEHICNSLCPKPETYPEWLERKTLERAEFAKKQVHQQELERRLAR